MTARGRAAGLTIVACAMLIGSAARQARAQVCSDPCTDDNVCTVNDHCSNNYCRGVALPNGSPCDDGDPGTVGDTCMAGVCVAVPTDGGVGDGSAAAPHDAANDDAAQQTGEPVGRSDDGGGCSVVGRGAGSLSGVLVAAVLALAAWMTRRVRAGA